MQGRAKKAGDGERARRKMPLRRAASKLAGWLNALAVRVTGGHLFAAAVTLLTLAIGFLVVLLLTEDSDAGRVTGSLTALGPVDVTLDAAPGEAISPVCGCFKIQHRKDWRGITFASRSIEISRENERGEGTYVISAANPEPASWAPGDLYFPAQLLIFERDYGSGGNARFKPGAIAKGQEQPGWRLLNRQRLPPQEVLQLTTSAPLNVDMLGPTPVGAWVPSQGGKVHLAFAKGLTANARVRGELTETDPHQGHMGPLGHPLADFLGPDVLIWTRGSRAQVESAAKRLSGSKSLRGRDIITAIWIERPPFATRIAAMPGLLPPRLTTQRFFAAYEVQKTSGPYRMRLTGKPLSHSDYARIQARFRNDNTFFLENLTGFFPATRPDGEPYFTRECHGNTCVVEIEETLQQGQRMKFRYPPRPPAEQGFTVFGPLQSLHLTQAKGALSSDQTMLVPTDLTLHDVDLLGPSVEGALPVPADEGDYVLDLSASGSGRIDGQPLVAQESFRSQASLFLYIVTAMGAIVGLYLAAVAYANRNK